MLFDIIRNLLFLVCYILWVVGGFSILWPLPFFVLPSKYSNVYLELLFGIDMLKDPSGGSALPFFWMFITLPLGFTLIVVALALYFFVVKII